MQLQLGNYTYNVVGFPSKTRRNAIYLRNINKTKKKRFKLVNSYFRIITAQCPGCPFADVEQSDSMTLLDCIYTVEFGHVHASR
jgi:hypothetical protein